MIRLVFSMQEYEKRLENIKQEMSSQGLDALVLTKPDNIYYVSGYKASVIASSFSPLHALVIPANGELRLMTRVVETATVAETQWTKEPRLYGDSDDAFNLLAEILQESRTTAGTIGLEEGFLTVKQMKGIKQSLPQAKFKDITGVIESISIMPSEVETYYVRKAAEVTNKGFQRAIDVLKEGIYIYDVVSEIHAVMYKSGQADLFAGSTVGKRTPFIGIWAGPQGGCMHDTSTLKRIERGDLVVVEIWGSYNHYIAGAQGAIYVGDEPPPEIIENYKLVSDMYVAIRNATKAGAKTGDLYDAANKIYYSRRRVDYPKVAGYSMGLGMGSIRLVKGGQDILRPGLPLMLQATLTVPKCVCNATVMVTETGAEELTTPLLELTVKK